MQLIQAIAKATPRTVTTKYGDRTVVDAIGQDGQELTLWRPADDVACRSITNGSRIQVAIDSKGKASLVETPLDRAEAAARQPMGFQAQQSTASNRSAEIGDYIERLGKLYSHCYNTAEKQVGQALATPEVKDVATTLFIQAVRHFDL